MNPAAVASQPGDGVEGVERRDGARVAEGFRPAEPQRVESDLAADADGEPPDPREGIAGDADGGLETAGEMPGGDHVLALARVHAQARVFFSWRAVVIGTRLACGRQGAERGAPVP